MSYYSSNLGPYRSDLYQFSADQANAYQDTGFTSDEDESDSLQGMDVFTDIDNTYLLTDYDKENSPVNNEKEHKKTLTDNNINSLSKHNLRKRPNTLAKNTKPPRYSRIIHPTDAAASVKQDDSDKIQGISDDYSIKQHAFMRIQAFALTAVGLFGIAKRSGGKEDRQMNITVKSAALQVGKGSHVGKNKYHGAHDNATSGLHLEGFRESLIQEIIHEAEITPLKKRLLITKKFSEEQFAAMLKNPDEKSIRAIFDLIWPMHKNKPHTVFTGTETDLNLNTTTEAGILVNLGIDKHIERHRDEICDLYLQITHAEITQEEACAQYCVIIKDSLSKLELDIQDALAKIDIYQEKLLELDDKILEIDNYEGVFVNQIRNILENLQEQAQTINPTKSNTKSDADKENITPDNTAEIKKDADFHPKISQNKRFLNDSIQTIDHNKSDPLSTFKIWMDKRWDTLKAEIEDQQKNLTAYLKYCQLEKDGTEDPDFTMLFGEFNPDTGKRELYDSIYSNVQERLWQTMSPTKLTNAKRTKEKMENDNNNPDISPIKKIQKKSL